ncbi:MAG: glycerate kinase, partial [Desulfuromonas sp.]
GMLQALGAHLLDDRGHEIGPGGGALAQLAKIDTSDLDSRLRECHVDVACDVDNPLTGSRGASAVFGPQKGATQEMVAQLDTNLSHFAKLVERDLGKTIAEVAGAGAAGGMGGALLGFLDASLRPGVEIVIDAINLKILIQDADLVITGEGRIDGQSVFGKTPVGIAKIALQHGVPVIAIAGSLGNDAEEVLECGISVLFSIVQGPCTLENALAEAAQNVRKTSRQIAAVMKLSGLKNDQCLHS